MATNLVTGAAEFIGFHLCQSLLVQEQTVIGLDNLSDYYSRTKRVVNTIKGLSPHSPLESYRVQRSRLKTHFGV